MIGTVMILQFETYEELQAWKQGEPYITQKNLGIRGRKAV